jgi:hypothetical protein
MPWTNPFPSSGQSRLVLKVIEQAFKEKYEKCTFEAPNSVKNCTNLGNCDFFSAN